jgi:hypothetical protein
MTRIVVPLAMVFVLATTSVAVCDDTALGSREIVQAAFGGGFWGDVDGRSRTVSFHALRYADGTVEGWYHAQVRARSPRARIIARLDCLHVAGNVAWMGGVIESAANPDNVGRRLFLEAVDNGEGADASADELGGRWEDLDCATEPDAQLQPIRGGNVTVLGDERP